MVGNIFSIATVNFLNIGDNILDMPDYNRASIKVDNEVFTRLKHLQSQYRFMYPNKRYKMSKIIEFLLDFYDGIKDKEGKEKPETSPQGQQRPNSQ